MRTRYRTCSVPNLTTVHVQFNTTRACVRRSWDMPNIALRCIGGRKRNTHAGSHDHLCLV